MPIFPFEGKTPKIHPTAFIAPTAVIIGDVEIGAHASIWYGAVLRGDIAPVKVGDRSNVQDNSVLHTDRDHPCIIKESVTIGHICNVHGAIVESGCLVGMGVTILSGAILGERVLVGAGALVTGKTFEAEHLVLGSPAKVVRKLTPEDLASMAANTDRYVANGPRHSKALEEWQQIAGRRL